MADTPDLDPNDYNDRTKLTSLRVNPELYLKFRILSARYKLKMAVFMDRCMRRYLSDAEFKKWANSAEATKTVPKLPPETFQAPAPLPPNPTIPDPIEPTPFILTDDGTKVTLTQEEIDQLFR